MGYCPTTTALRRICPSHLQVASSTSQAGEADTGAGVCGNEGAAAGQHGTVSTPAGSSLFRQTGELPAAGDSWHTSVDLRVHHVRSSSCPGSSRKGERHAGLHEAGGGGSAEVQGGKGLANLRHCVPSEQPGSRSQVGRTGPIALCSLRGRPGCIYPQWSYVGTAQGPTIQPKAAPSHHSSLRRRLASHYASPRREDRGASRGRCANRGIRENAVSPVIAIIGNCSICGDTHKAKERTALAAPPPAGRHDSPTGAWEETGARGGFLFESCSHTLRQIRNDD